MALRPGPWCVLCLALGGCYDSSGGDGPPDGDCIDHDGDGFGSGEGCRGPDCDDGDEDHAAECALACAPGDRSPGCACEEAGSDGEVCYTGPDGTAGRGICASGVRVCRRGEWTSCEDQVLPDDEVCDGVDNDCDGAVDEGLTSECGNCDPGCTELCLGAGCDGALEPGEGAERQQDGSVAVARTADLAPRALWVSSTTGGTVVRIDTRTRERTGTFDVGRGGAAPYAVAVDGEGNAYVANWGGGEPSTLVKILARDCPDRNGDGVVRTSDDEEALDWDDDECVAYSAEIDDCDAWCDLPKSIVLTEGGARAWISFESAGKVIEVDTGTGEPTGREVDVGQYAEGLAVDADRNLWVLDFYRLHRVSLDDLEDTDSFSLDNAQAFATDLDVGDDGQVYVVSPLGVWTEDDDLVSSGWQASDVAVDAAGNVWAVDPYAGGEIRRFDGDLEDHVSFEVENMPNQIAIDLDGLVWVTDQTVGSVQVVDAGLASTETVVEACSGFQQEGDCVAGALLAGDPTGFRFRRTFGLGDVAEAFGTVQACDGAATWTAIGWEADGEVDLSARAGGAGEWAYVGSTPPAAGGTTVTLGPGALEISATLHGASARLVRITVQGTCPLH